MNHLLSELAALGGPGPSCSAVPGCGALSPVMCSTFFYFLQLQSSLTLIGIGIAWLWASQSRVRESRRIKAAQRAGNPLAFVNSDVATLSHDKQRQLPKVTVVLAVKGAGEASMANWRSQLVTLYGGQLEYVFCVESKEDPAYEAVQMLQKEMAGVCNVRLVVAGLATSCSQQIHNQLAGAESADPSTKYLLFLDDDIQCHPGTIGVLVDSLEEKPEVFVATGYSFDVPSTHSLGAYAAMCYRLPLLVGMSGGGPCFFVWGGCIMIRAGDLRSNRHGMHTALKKNGYSNDLILTSVAGQHNRAVWCPTAALFPGRMSGDWTMTRYWNYVRRQIFALLTYCNSFAYRTNRTGWVAYSYLASALMLPLLPSVLHVAHSMGLLGYQVLAPVLGASDPLGVGAAAAGGLSTLVPRLSMCPIGLGLSYFNVLALGFATLMCVRLFFAAITLCNLLSPEKKPIEIGKLSLGLGVLGMLVNLTMVPIIAVFTLCKADITWAGIRYVRRRGIVASVEHPPQLHQVSTGGHEEAKEESGEEAAVEPRGSGAGAGQQEMVSLEERDQESVAQLAAAEERANKLAAVDLMQQLKLKSDLEAQLAQGEDDPLRLAADRALLLGLGKGMTLRPQGKGQGSYLGPLDSWFKAFPVLGRAMSPGQKKLG